MEKSMKKKKNILIIVRYNLKEIIKKEKKIYENEKLVYESEFLYIKKCNGNK